ncbi:MAG: PAS domain S-box protein, partial [Candidatus Competibacteraceae bacterium]
ERAEYFPVYYLEPHSGNEVALGYAPDLTHPARRLALAQARDSGQLIATARYKLVQEKNQQFAVLVYAPVYAGQGAMLSVEERRQQLRGFVLGVIRPGAVVEAAIEKTTPQNLMLRLLDRSTEDEQQWLYEYPPSLASQEPAATSQLLYTQQFPFADHAWQIEIRPNVAFTAANTNQTYRWIALSGALLTLLTALYLFTLVSQRAQAETLVDVRTAELRESEQRYRQLFEAHPESMLVYDRETLAFLAVNDMAVHQYGYSRDEFLRMTLAEICPPEDVPPGPETVAPVAGGLDAGNEQRHQKRDGTLIDVEITSHTLLFEGRNAKVILARDITERKRTEAALRESEQLFRSLFEKSGDANLLLDNKQFLDCNAATLAILGATEKEQILRHRPAELSPEYQPDGRLSSAKAREAIDSALREGSYRIEWVHRRFDGSDFWVEVLLTAIPWHGQQILHTAWRDISERKQVEEALRTSEARFRDLLNMASDWFWEQDAQHRSTFLSPSAERLGIQSASVLGKMPWELPNKLSPDQWAAHRSLLDAHQPFRDFEYPLCLESGGELWCSINGQPVFNASGQYLGYRGTGRDITERKRAEERHRLASVVFETARESIIVTDSERKIVAVNPTFTILTGYTETEVLGKNPRLLKSGRQSDAHYATMWRIIAMEGSWQGELWNRRKDGELYMVLASINEVRDSAGRLTHYVGIATDITMLKKAEQRIEHLAYYDILTHLPNRALLAQRAELALALAARRHEELAVLFLDLDRFKEVNDSLGHAEGDALLKQVAAQLQDITREADTICRLGGDEFALLLPTTGREGALRVADKLLTALRQPFTVAGHSLRVTTSIGIALYPHDGASFDELLKNADAALYQAKQEGRNTRVFYVREMNIATFERLILESELRKAIEAGHLQAYFQPKVYLADGRMAGAEALVRWRHPDHGLIPPGRFIPVAEASDLIVTLGNWMLEEVCRQLATWREARLPPLAVAVNLAARHFHDPDLIERVKNLLATYELKPQALELELTESTLLGSGAQTTETLLALQQLGIGLAIDDFGTGYSSLGYLKRLPITALKIDQGFVRDLATDPDDRTLAATIVTLGHSLGLSVVAEGVETAEQRDILLEQGCDSWPGLSLQPPHARR